MQYAIAERKPRHVLLTYAWKSIALNILGVVLFPRAQAPRIPNLFMSVSTSVLIIIILLSGLALAQSEKLPAVLAPDATSVSEAERVGGEAFKLLSRNTFPDP